ncbi:MAG: hypothetical protein O7H41_21355 [Planctomycetota bacterium]|nr:hypothetical protein [Planctomycetota bacterium]
MSGALSFGRGLLEPLWRYPQTITVLASLPLDQVGSTVANVKAARDELGLDQLESLHFFRIIVVDEEPDLRGRMLPPRLIVSAVYDGRMAEFLRALVHVAGERLRLILEHCDGFPVGGGPDDVEAWLRQHAERAKTLHIGTFRDKLDFIKEEYRLRLAIGSYVDRRHTAGDWIDGDVVAIRRDIQGFVRAQGDLPHGLRQGVPWWLRLLETLDLLRIVVMLTFLPMVLACLNVWWFGCSWWYLSWLTPMIFLLLIGLYFLVVRMYELTEGDLVTRPKAGHVAALVEEEDFGIQNQFTMLSTVRESWFRRLNLRFVLFLANGFSKHWYRRGQLAGIDTIHFARIHLIDRGRRLLFMSEFDGGWERYLFDFLGVGSFAVVPIWTNLHGCPKTRFLLSATKGFSQRFLPFTRANQRQTNVWYSAIDHLTVAEILRNAEIRAGLFGWRSRAGIEKWLQLI